MTASEGPVLPGRLGHPNLVFRDDPRVDPRLVAALEMSGGAGEAPPSIINGDSRIEDILAFLDVADRASEAPMAASVAGLPPVEGITTSVENLRAPAGHEISVFVHRPDNAEASAPGVLHLHGGGMVMLDAAGPVYTRWREELAAAGLVVLGVEFRNAAGKLGPHPFPAGLDDCAFALEWAHANRDRLGISKLVVSGDSGGGNLSLATALRAKSDGRLHQLDGVYAMCPYISNAYAERLPELTSLYENDGLLIDRDMTAAMAKAYDPNGHNATNPLAWPYHASTDQMVGLPPHVISVNELDPLRDEGLAYFRKLLAAGVSAVGRTVNGTCHAAENIFIGTIPDVSHSTIRDIAGFAHSL